MCEGYGTGSVVTIPNRHPCPNCMSATAHAIGLPKQVPCSPLTCRRNTSSPYRVVTTGAPGSDCGMNFSRVGLDRINLTTTKERQQLCVRLLRHLLCRVVAAGQHLAAHR